MRDDTEDGDNGPSVRDALTRISRTLCVHVETFYGSNAEVVEHLRREEEAHLLMLVRAYLQHVDHADVQHFVTAVQALAEAEAQDRL
jgi:uncharacterized hydantoinase/oxoprolinase family protein